MCVLVIGWRMHRDVPWIVASNRDEAYARPSAPPSVQRIANHNVLLPIDLSAGGSWLGVSSGGVVCVITNRRDGDFDAKRPSRGGLVHEILGSDSAEEARARLERCARRNVFNSFNLFYADASHAFVSAWNGQLETRRLEPGAHVLSNLHALGELAVPELAAIPWQADVATELAPALKSLLASHTARDADGFRLCKHGKEYGTVSASLIYAAPLGAWVLEYAPGPPCEVAFALHHVRQT